VVDASRVDERANVLGGKAAAVEILAVQVDGLS